MCFDVALTKLIGLISVCLEKRKKERTKIKQILNKTETKYEFIGE